MALQHIDAGVASHIGSYSDAVGVTPGARWLTVSGTPGLREDGTLPETFAEQAAQAWRNLVKILDHAGFGVADLVKITQYLTDAEDISGYPAIRSQFLGSARPASMLLVVPALVWPGMSIEIEAWAARAD